MHTPLRRIATCLPLATLLAGAASASPPEAARAQGALDGEQPRVEATLLVHPDDAGRVRRLGVWLEPDPGWHLYWRNPGESGLATRLRFEIPDARAGAVSWPAPSSFRESLGDPGDTLLTYGYDAPVLLTVEATLDGDRPGRVARVVADVLLCRDECIPARLKLERALDAVPTGREAEAVRRLFATSRARVPVPAEALGLKLALQADRGPARGEPFTAELRLLGSDVVPASFEFFPERHGGIELAAIDAGEPSAARDTPMLRLQGRVTGDGTPQLRGVLTVRQPDGAAWHLAVDLPLEAADAGAFDPGLPGLLEALLLAFLGGLILNLMPCVLPVLTIKAIAITELARQGRRQALAHGAAYAGGIAVTMQLLALSVLAMRAAGRSVGWGFQFQEPLFIAALSAVLVVFALNLFGVFEISLNAGRLASLSEQASGAGRSFFDGALAVVLATPCSAPFLGTAVGFAFAGPGAVIPAIFALIGAGLAFPFVALACTPAFGRLLPRPGAWMLELRAFLGFALIGTCAWLLWIFGRTTGVDGLVALLAWLVGVAFAAWLYGVAQRSGRARWKLLTAVAVLFLCVTGAGELATPAAGGSRAEPFDRAAIDASLQQGHPAFVYFTADWCITCAANERLVLSHGRVQAELERLDVAVFRADWTRRSETIRAELARFGKAGVPLYLVYPAGGTQPPRVLPALLTVDLLVAELRTARPSRGESDHSGGNARRPI